MNGALPAVIGLLGLIYPALFAAMTLTRAPKWRAKSRFDVLVTGISASVTLVLVHEYFAWWIVPVALWLLPMGIFAAAVAGAVITWPSLRWARPGRTQRRTVLGLIVSILFAGAVVFLVAR